MATATATLIPKELQHLCVPIKKLKPYPRNNKVHEDFDIDIIAASIQEYGFRDPVEVDSKNVVIVGHGRLLAAQKLGMTEVPVIKHSLSKQKAAGYRIANNKSTDQANYDFQNLTDEILELDDMNFNLEALGVPEGEVEQMMTWTPDGEPKDDNFDAAGAADKIKNPKSKRGQIYQLGKHWLMCGDATSKADVEKLMDGKKAALVNTDPPYGIDFVSLSKSKGQSKQYKSIENDHLTEGAKLQEFLEKAIKAALPHLIENPAFYLWHPMLTQGTFFAAAAASIIIHRQIIWVKPSFVFGRGDYHWKHELCFYGWIKGKRCSWFGSRSQDTVWEIGRENDKIHPTQKPVELFTRPLLNHTKAKDCVYEPFAGSGTQVIACEQLKRTCYMMEIDPVYCDVIRKRYQEFMTA